MKKSKHNIVSKIADSDDYFILNPLTLSADILSSKEFEIYDKGINELNSKLLEKGYIIDEKAEDEMYLRKYLEFIDAREKDEIQLFFVPNYTCNFTCSYCYQDDYATPKHKIENKVIDAFFNYIDSTFSERRKYITLFGGEPLLNTKVQREFLDYFIRKVNNRNLELAIVTNGYNLSEYISLIKECRIREVQVTIDGTAEVHDKRRILKGGGKSFDKIVSGIDDALLNNIPINLRMVLDKDNISELPKLADFAIQKKWTSSEIFKTQLGRNYELHHCQSSSSRLYSRIEMYKDIYELLKEYPRILEFHKPAFSISKFIFEEGTLPDPLFDSCPGTKTEWAFDYAGKIFSCTATVGKPGEQLGTFYPNVEIDEDLVIDWQDRDVLSIYKCKTCNLRLACGGGCASVAKNHFGTINSPDCRPVKELLELGIAHYFNQ